MKQTKIGEQDYKLHIINIEFFATYLPSLVLPCEYNPIDVIRLANFVRAKRLVINISKYTTFELTTAICGTEESKEFHKQPLPTPPIPSAILETDLK
jgi:hypothetical protein